MKETPLTRLAAGSEEVRETKGTLHTPGEILQQPWLWRETAGRVAALRDRAEAVMKGAEFAVLTGAGSSLHAARLMEDAGRARLGTAVSSVSCTELMLSPEAFIPRNRKGVLISLSRSGESPESVEAARIVAERFPQVGHLAITCNGEGTLAKRVQARPDGVCLALHPKSYDKGLGTTSSMTSTVVAGRLMLDPSGASRLEALAKAGEGVLADAERAETDASSDPSRVVVLGTGPLEAAAQEGAHKILELTDGQVTSMARSCLEFRHGPIAFAEEGTLLIGLVSPDPLVRRYDMDFLAQAVRMPVRKVVPFDVSERFASLKSGEVGVLGVVFCQMLALFLSLRRGLRPDRPGARGLVNPIVQGVTIHPREETS
ncbi:MAG TPA: hypothetical protein VJB14_08130 [Planctomycetota bacterium]|nr:hypothetical protein [Planctomycetota bacterium]